MPITGLVEFGFTEDYVRINSVIIKYSHRLPSLCNKSMQK